jgi:hypothetical protein
LLNALNHELETVHVPAHSFELLHAHRAGEIAQLRQQLRRKFAGLLVRDLYGLHGNPGLADRAHRRAEFVPVAVAGGGGRAPVGRIAAQGVQLRRALGERIERAGFTVQCVLRLVGYALHHQGQLGGCGHRSGAAREQRQCGGAGQAKYDEPRQPRQ